MMNIFEIATNIKTPLALSGFLAAVFFYVVRKIIAKDAFPKLTKKIASDIYKLIINCTFILSLVAMTFGFLGYILTYTDFRISIHHEVEPIHITVDVNVRVDRALDNFFGDIDAAEEKLDETQVSSE